MFKWHFMGILYKIEYVKAKGVIIAEKMLVLLMLKPCELLMLGWFLWRNRTYKKNELRVILTQLLSSLNCLLVKQTYKTWLHGYTKYDFSFTQVEHK
jgi:hypothetical protein